MLENCILTRRVFDHTYKNLSDIDFNGYKYYFTPVGIVHIGSYAIDYINNVNKNIDVSILAGLCRCAYELHETPPVIDTKFLDSLDSLKSIPRTFQEKYDHFLSIFYRTGGKEYKSRTIEVEDDYPLAYAKDEEEFRRIIDYGLSSGDLECLNTIDTEEQGIIMYLELRFTPNGLKKVVKLINNYFSIIQPKIDSGNFENDRKISHALSLFYQENASIEDKRSACEELSFILEPFRKEMGKFFNDKDVNLFFHMVNEFDIRHNKESTKKLIYEEQIEWVFQCLLNTLITYIKLKKRFVL